GARPHGAVTRAHAGCAPSLSVFPDAPVVGRDTGHSLRRTGALWGRGAAGTSTRAGPHRTGEPGLEPARCGEGAEVSRWPWSVPGRMYRIGVSVQDCTTRNTAGAAPGLPRWRSPAPGCLRRGSRAGTPFRRLLRRSRGPDGTRVVQRGEGFRHRPRGTGRLLGRGLRRRNPQRTVRVRADPVPVGS